MQYKHSILVVFLSFFFLLMPRNYTAHAAVKHPDDKIILMRSNILISSVVPGTPTDTSTYTTTPSDTPTTTLQPLPAITLIFPVSTETSTATITPKPIFITATSTPSAYGNFSSLPPRLTLLLVFLFILWIFLASFLIIYIRQFK
jgi:hypothetical protein